MKLPSDKTEPRKKLNFFLFSSIATAFEELAGNQYGERALHQNAALALWLATPEAERERWITSLLHVRRAKDDQPMLDRVHQAMGVTPLPDPAAPTAPETLQGRAGKELGDAPQAPAATPRNRRQEGA